MKDIISNKIIGLLIITFTLIVGFISQLFQVDMFIIIMSIFVGLLIVFYSYIDEKRLLFFTLVLSILAPFMSNYVSIIGYIPQVYLLLMIVKLLEKKIIRRKSISIDYISLIIIFSLIILSCISLFYEPNSNKNLIFILYILLKRFAIIIVYIYTLNINLNEQDIRELIKVFGILLLIQIPIVLIQFMGGVDRDSITGLMGNNATGYAIQFIILYFLLYSSYKKLKKSFVYFYFISVLVYCAIAEVKIGFFCIPILVIILLKDTKKFISKIIFVIFSLIALIISYNLLVKFNPYHDFLQRDFIKQYLSKSYVVEETTINRNGYMPVLKEYILNNKKRLLIGRGIGATNSHGSIQILRGDVDKSFGYLEISIFAIPTLITEFGLIGIGIYMLFFLRLFIIFIKNYKKNNSVQPVILIIITVLFMWYNNSILNNFYNMFFTAFLLSINYKKIKRGLE